MIRYLLAGAALAALATSAQARDHSAYFGLEVGPMLARDSTVTDRGTGDRLFDIDYKTGVDGDLIAGYDFGLIRAEVEAGHKWASQRHFHLDDGTSVEGSGHTSGFTDMANLLLDLGKNESFNFYVGGGAGLAWLNERSTLHLSETPPVDFQSRIKTNGHFAWQAIAGVRAPVFRYFDIGLKYRYFNAGHLSDDGLRGEFRSHSVLASLIYNFAGAAPPPPPPPPPPLPPPPPPPPATQTCPDGTVVLMTDACPAPPPPPPPPPPSPERGY
jgi:opacity protein-like surface antigen